MNDVEHLACEHNIQARLYSGDLLGDNRVTRWLSTCCDDTYDDQELWSKLTEFSEKELRVQQQKLLIQEENDDKRFRSNPEERVNIISQMHTLQIKPNQTENVISVMKMKTI